jgi:hypothetical protein
MYNYHNVQSKYLEMQDGFIVKLKLAWYSPIFSCHSCGGGCGKTAKHSVIPVEAGIQT